MSTQSGGYTQNLKLGIGSLVGTIGAKAVCNRFVALDKKKDAAMGDSKGLIGI